MSKAVFDRFAYPRLALTIAVGVGLLAIAAVFYFLGPRFGSGLRPMGRQLAIVGYLILLLGASGRIAFAFFDRTR